MTKWEYKTITRGRLSSRKYSQVKIGIGQVIGIFCFEDGRKIPVPSSMDDKLARLGDEEWELVTVEPLASIVGGGGGGLSSDYSGFTTAERWALNDQSRKLYCTRSKNKNDAY